MSWYSSISLSPPLLPLISENLNPQVNVPPAATEPPGGNGRRGPYVSPLKGQYRAECR